MTTKVLVVDDDVAMCRLLQAGLTTVDLNVVWRNTAEEAFALVKNEDVDLVLTDVRMHGDSGIDLCRRVAKERPNVPVIVITAFGSMETAVEAMRAGAYDFVTKPFDLSAIRLTVARALEHRKLHERVRHLELALAETRSFDGLQGTSAAIHAVYDLVDRIAPSAASVLISGESGTGKELIARAIHTRSPRKGKPFVAINCAAMPESLLESELFGHEKGAFTDARTARQGLFLQANGGTLMLDEIGELPLSLQPKLLRALQEKRVRPVGATQEIPFDARLVAATNRDLEQAAKQGKFREDLLYRIAVIHLEVPPLRARGNDILQLAQHFVERFAAVAGKNVTGISQLAAERLLSYGWPGNVRELQNCIERAVTLTRLSEISMEDLPQKVVQISAPSALVAENSLSDMPALEEVERRYILRVFDLAGSNKSLAAKVLGLNRKTLHRKLVSYGLDEPGMDDASGEG
jgi:two-component system, NtrC family, response regulator AtoC